MQIVCEGLLKCNAFRLGTLCNLIAGGVHDDTGVIIVLLHHIFEILLPPVIHIGGIVMLGFVHIPAVNILIHHQHAQLVTRIEKILGGRVMGGTNSIVAGLLQDADAAFFHFRVGAGAENTVVMMNTGASDYGALSIESNAFFRRPCQGANAERFIHNIIPKGDTGCVEIRLLR